MEYNRAKTVDHFVEEVQAGRLELSGIRPKLEQENVPDEEIRIVFRLVDRQVQKGVLQVAENDRNRNMLYGGLILCGAGLVVTVGTYLGIFDMRGYYLVAYGPILGGGLMALSGYQNMRRG